MTPIRRRLLYIFRGSLLRLRISWQNNNQLTVSTGYHVDRTDLRGKQKWDGERCLRNTTHGPDHTPASTINRYLEALEQKIEAAFYAAEAADSIPTPQQIKTAISDKPAAKPATIAELSKKYLNEAAALNQWSPSTARLNRQALAQLAAALGPDSRLDDIDDTAKARLLDHMTSRPTFVMKHDNPKPVKKTGLSNNSINRYMTMISTFARWAVEKGLAKECALTKKNRLLNVVPNPVVFLTMEELARFRAVPLPPDKQEVADAFSFCCFTGLRYSDIADLRWSQVNDDSIRIVTRKTHDPITIELNDFSRRILATRRRGLPEEKVFDIIDNALFNRATKQIARLAGIDTPVKTTTYCGATRTDTILPKWQHITSHTPRKTFVTNALSLGIPPAIVMQWTGHKNYKAMKPYIDIVSDTKKRSMTLFNTLHPTPAAEAAAEAEAEARAEAEATPDPDPADNKTPENT